MTIISKIPEIMDAQNISYEDLQYSAKIAPDTIARARDSRIASCQLKTLEKIADALDVHVHDLFEQVKSKESIQDM
ncbi:MAG: helix-turn-helix transcriptional regulator [Pseudomonadota bacterium]